MKLDKKCCTFQFRRHRTRAAKAKMTSTTPTMIHSPARWRHRQGESPSRIDFRMQIVIVDGAFIDKIARSRELLCFWCQRVHCGSSRTEFKVNTCEIFLRVGAKSDFSTLSHVIRAGHVIRRKHGNFTYAAIILCGWGVEKVEMSIKYRKLWSLHASHRGTSVLGLFCGNFYTNSHFHANFFFSHSKFKFSFVFFLPQPLPPPTLWLPLCLPVGVTPFRGKSENIARLMTCQ